MLKYTTSPSWNSYNGASTAVKISFCELVLLRTICSTIIEVTVPPDTLCSKYLGSFASIHQFTMGVGMFESISVVNVISTVFLSVVTAETIFGPVLSVTLF